MRARDGCRSVITKGTSFANAPVLLNYDAGALMISEEDKINLCAYSKAKNDGEQSYDKAMNLMSSGGIVISLLVLKEAAEKVDNIDDYIVWWFIGVAAFTVSMLSNIISHRLTIATAIYMYNCIATGEEPSEEVYNKKNARSPIANLFAITSLFVGIFSIYLFIFKVI